MVRGHDHEPERYRIYERYTKHPVVTINAMSYKQRDVFGPFQRQPVAARWRMNQPLSIHQLTIPPILIKELYGSASVEDTPSEDPKPESTRSPDDSCP